MRRDSVRAEEIQSWLAETGFPEATGLTPMQPGLGSTGLWSFTPSAGAPRLVIRIFGEGADHVAEREFLAMTAARGGVPVPEIVCRGTIAGRPLLVATFLPGVQASEALMAGPDRAFDFGVAMGLTLGRLHAVVAPDGLDRPDRSWLALGGPALEPLRARLVAVSPPDRLLHLDYHLLNVLVDGGEVTGVIDWENTRTGPPWMDLGRSRALLRAAMIGYARDPAEREALAQVERGLVAGHATEAGADPDPGLSIAWGLAMTVADLEAQLAKPDSPVPPELVARLVTERDAAIASVPGSDG
jgi:aminoglycoside phosphotransferase (APT) family kinase protein